MAEYQAPWEGTFADPKWQLSHNKAIAQGKKRLLPGERSSVLGRLDFSGLYPQDTSPWIVRGYVQREVPTRPISEREAWNLAENAGAQLPSPITDWYTYVGPLVEAVRKIDPRLRIEGFDSYYKPKRLRQSL
ncbi:MAG TPA: hypothetical protein VJK52_04035 [Candidatus Nanoarchaeia archaeon]|nr:hypothetical protein [Candidatus Nanoarchaeia archaeon]